MLFPHFCIADSRFHQCNASQRSVECRRKKWKSFFHIYNGLSANHLQMKKEKEKTMSEDNMDLKSIYDITWWWQKFVVSFSDSAQNTIDESGLGCTSNKYRTLLHLLQLQSRTALSNTGAQRNCCSVQKFIHQECRYADNNNNNEWTRRQQ